MWSEGNGSCLGEMMVCLRVHRATKVGANLGSAKTDRCVCQPTAKMNSPLVAEQQITVEVSCRRVSWQRCF